MQKYLSLLFVWIVCVSLNAVAAPTDFPGMISVGTDGAQAVDVVGQHGQIMMPEDLTRALKSGVDISLLNPAPSDLWQDSAVKPLNAADYTLGLQSGVSVDWVSNTPSVVGEYRFIIQVQVNGVIEQYQAVLGKKAHNILLRKAVLEKLGYQVQPVQWLSKMRVKLNGHASLMGFLTDIKNNTEGNPSRWVTNDTTNTSIDYVDLQDVLVMPAVQTYYSLETGAIPPAVIQGRRVMNALLVPFQLVDVPESLNSFSWVAGRVVNQAAYLNYEWASWFNPTFQDAQWIVRRLARLSAQDWKEVAQASFVPPEVATLLAEKLKSRRNDLTDLFKVSAVKLAVNSKISSGARLTEGKLTATGWPGYASRFSFGDPDNPLSTSEVTAFLKSKGISALIDSAMSYMNSFFNNNDSVQGQVNQRTLDNVVDQMIHQAITGQKKNIPLGMYAIPSWSGRILLSRDVVVGSYMGTDNLVQMADTFGFQITPGFFIGIQGLNGISESGGVGLQMQRSYTHIKPLKSIKAVNKTPYRNMLVPFLKKKWAAEMDQPMTTVDGQSNLVAIADALDKEMAVGESLLITDSVTAQAGLNLTYPTSPSVQLQTSLNAAQMFLHRIQIYKKDKYTFQIYNDPGRVTKGSAAVGLTSYGVPLVTFSVGGMSGKVNTKFYTLVIGSSDTAELERNQREYETNVRILKQIFMSNSLEMLNTEQDPTVIGHDFSERDVNFGFLFYQARKMTVKDRFEITLPEGAQTSVLYRSTGVRTGKDYYSLAMQTLAGFLREKVGSDNIVLDGGSNGNPGDTFMGSSVSRVVNYQGTQKDPKNPNSGLTTNPEGQFAQVVHQHKGWNITRDKALKILKDMNEDFGVKLIPDASLSDTRKILLYSITLTINVYKQGLERLATLPRDQVEMLMRNSMFDVCNVPWPKGECDRAQKSFDTHFRRYLRSQKEYLAARISNGPEAADRALAMVDLAETYFPGRKLVSVVGEQNIFIQARVQGFRQNDELGDSPLMGNTIGVVGARASSGPLNFIQQNLQIQNGEFFITWLLNPL
ncbi:hypothetical protein [Bdellovibrio sp. HCB209]|uniref:hypothetical protein n=1 Tax=Bdellovibrio sp. HCB209 TaxID=3394354 RepID=UPI0039B55791